MNEFKKRQRLKKIIYSRAIFVLLVIICLFFAHGVWGIFWKYRGSVADENQLKSKLVDLSSQEAYLASSTAELESQSGVQYALQEKFGAVKPGEKEIVIVDYGPTTTPALPPESLFTRFWSWLTSL